MADPLLIILTVAGAVAILAVACTLTAVLVRQQCRAELAEQLARRDDEISALWHAWDNLRSRVSDGEHLCDGWHDLVDVHKHAIDNLRGRVDQLETATVLPPVEPVRELLFAETVRDHLLPILRVDTGFETAPLAIARAAEHRPADNTATAFTRAEALRVKALTTVTGELAGVAS